jgi:hypothetical protein
MQITTISVTKDLRDVVKLGAVQNKMTMQRYIELLVMADLEIKNVSR